MNIKSLTKLVSRIEAFGHRNLIDHSVIRKMITIMEELGVAILQEHFQEETDAELSFEYQEGSGKLSVKAVYTGAGFDPLKEGDRVSMALIRNIMQDISSECNDRQGIIIGTVH